MNTFTYRDSRRQQLENALAALTPDLEPLRPPLARELASLTAGDWRVTDRTYLTAATDMLWSLSQNLLPALDSDLARVALGGALALSTGQVAAVQALSNGVGAPPPDYLQQVQAAVSPDEAAFDALVQTGHRLWLDRAADAAYPFDDVGVLLPLRLETLFDKPKSEHNPDPLRWQLSLRVFPDEASVCRDNRFVSDGERAALTLFWQAVRRPGTVDPAWLDGDTAAVAWQQLCARVAPPRAAWLIGAVAVAVDGDEVVVQLPEAMPDGPEPNRVGGMPPALRVTVVTSMPVDGTSQHPIGRLPMDEATVIDAEALTLALPGTLANDADMTRDSWWASWEKAQQVGLGGVWLLPTGVTPDNIAALYVVGLGDDAPDAHFKAQVAAGELSVLPLGAPTNSVRGAAAADLGRNPTDWRHVAQMRLRQQLGMGALAETGRTVQHYLLGDDGALPFFAGADSADTTQDSRLLVRALWPALWGHWLHDHWQLGDDAHRAGNWAIENLCPEGPLLPLRIGDQPYGLLPVTALAQWQPDTPTSADGERQNQFEAAMAAKVNALRGEWAAIARRTRSVVGGDSTHFMQLVGQNALSRRYIWRDFAPAWAASAAYALDAAQRDTFNQTVQLAYERTRDLFERAVVDPYLAGGHWRFNRLPLVQPTHLLYGHRHGEAWRPVKLSRFITLLFDDLGNNITPADLDLESIFRERWWVLDNDGEWQLGGLPNSLLIRLLIYATQIAALWRTAPTDSRPERRLFKAQQDGALTVAQKVDGWQNEDFDPIQERPISIMTPTDAERQQLERALRATLDSASARIDPWVTGFAWQRLRQHSASPRRTYRLGAYGWVDGPFDGQPGPTDAGRLHTPSYNQTLVALILRDNYRSSARGSLHNGDNRNPWEMNITAAKARLAEAIAEEVRLGFHIYEIIGRYVENVVGAHQTVKELRTSDRYAMRPERSDPHEVCNGDAALTGLLDGDPNFPLDGDQHAALRLIQDALDTYGDLLMSDGVLQLVNREAERAAETMDAAGGFSQPPSFQFLRTPPSGYQLESVVLSALPFVNVSSVPVTASPARLADPSVAAFLDRSLGNTWRWRALDPVDQTVLGSIDLVGLGLTPVDTLALSTDFLCDLARHMLGQPDAYIEAPREHALAQQLVAALGSRPAAGRDIADGTVDRPIRDELGRRYRRLRKAAQRTIAALLKNPATLAQRRLAIRRGLVWGITPVSEPALRGALFAALSESAPPADVATLADVAASMAAELTQRLDAAPSAPDSIQALTQAIVALAAPQAKLAILARWPKTALRKATGLKIAQPDAALDEAWLTVVAATRAPLARLEALQLEANPLLSWSSAPGDPWQQATVAENLAYRETGLLQIAMPRFVAAYGSAESWTNSAVAVGLIDAFSEAIPLPQRQTTAAFGFNAPAARAPQAILLAVPPRPRQRLDADLLTQIVAETRLTAQARMARLEDLGALQALTPTAWLQATGPLRMRLEARMLYEQ